MVSKTETDYDMQLRGTAGLQPVMLWQQYIFCILTFSQQDPLRSTGYD